MKTNRNFSRGVIWNAFPGEVRLFPVVLSHGVEFSISSPHTNFLHIAGLLAVVGVGEKVGHSYLKGSSKKFIRYACNTPGTVLSILYALSHLIFTHDMVR